MSKYCNHCMAELNEAETKCSVCGKENDGAVPAHHLLPGTILNGKFYVGEALGEGGFGITYIGRDIKLDMKVAIKEFYPNGYVNRSNTISPQVNDSVTEGRRDFFEKGRERFLKEAQILAKFSGEPGVVDVRDFFEENNTAYIIMEFLDGVDLKTHLKKNGTLTPEQTIQLLMPVMNSLKKVHAQGLIHRDISPDNIMIIGNKVKLLDFGAARTVSAAANKSLSVMLKPGYAPEEQYRSKGDQGPWTDIYALCATMYKCITGVTPDDATQRVFSDEVKTPSALNIAIKPEIEKAIMRGMSVHQNDRYQCIEDLIRGLQGIDVAVSGSDQTVAAGKNVVDDDLETVYVPNDTDDKTVMGEDVATSIPKENNVGADAKDTSNTVVTSNTTEKAKSKTGLFIGIAVAAVAVIALIIVLLIPKGGNSDVPKDDGSSTTGSQTTESTTTPDDKEIVMSDELFDFTFTLEGVVYQLPCKYETLTKNGWTISSSGYNSETKIEGNSYDSFYMAKDGRKVTVYAYNMSGNVKAIKDCKIGGIECDGYNEVDFTVAKGVTVKSSVDEIKNAFGVPGYSNSGSDYQSMTYYAVKDSSYNSVKFYVSNDSKYSSISMKNFVESDDDKTTTNTEKPAYLNEYKKPSSMGADLKSPVVKVEGDLYQLPAPVSEFLGNGWKVIQQSGDVVAGGTDSIRVEKGGKKLDLYIVNYSEYQTTVENCAVYKVYVDNYGDTKVSIGSEGKSITIGTAKADVEAIITDDFDYYEGSYSHSYSYSEYKERDFSVSINVDKETGKVSTISISCKTWKY